jgi:hypothetical protein
MIHNAISQALYESQVQTINMLKSYICSKKMDQTESFLKILEDFSTNLKLPKPVPKPKKDPSDYNLFIRDRINEYKKQNPSCNGHDLMRMATAAWKLAHPKNV